MSINMELMRKKLATLRGEGDKEQSAWFKPDEGDQDIRIVPSSDGDPLKEVYFHYNVGEHRGGIMFAPSAILGKVVPFANLHLRYGAKAYRQERRRKQEAC